MPKICFDLQKKQNYLKDTLKIFVFYKKSFLLNTIKVLCLLSKVIDQEMKSNQLKKTTEEIQTKISHEILQHDTIHYNYSCCHLLTLDNWYKTFRHINCIIWSIWIRY